MKRKKLNKSDFLIRIVLITAAFVAIFPLLALFISSFLPSSELIRKGITLNINFSEMSLKNYTYLFQEFPRYWTWYKNSILITLLTIVISVFTSAVVGYALAKYDFKFRNIIFISVLISMMVPFEILMLPISEIIAKLNLTDTYLGIMLPMLVSPMAVFFFRQYAMTLPDELMDAARIDGTTEYGIFFKIMLPLMKPAMASMAILQAMFSWNNFLWPLLVVRTTNKFTLPIGLASLLTPYGNNYDVLIAGSVLTVLPIIIIFIFMQKYFIAGLTDGSVKG